MGSVPVGRTVVVAIWLFTLAVAGRPDWLAAPLAIVLVLVWASPYLLATNRRSAAVASRRPVVGPGKAGSGS
jgi:hypothetical protein